MKIEGVIYTDDGNKICNFTSSTRDNWKGCVNLENNIKFENDYLQELEIIKIAQLYKSICEMI